MCSGAVFGGWTGAAGDGARKAAGAGGIVRVGPGFSAAVAALAGPSGFAAAGLAALERLSVRIKGDGFATGGGLEEKFASLPCKFAGTRGLVSFGVSGFAASRTGVLPVSEAAGGAGGTLAGIAARGG